MRRTRPVQASLGCGVPTAVADLRDGDVMLDLGSGAGAAAAGIDNAEFVKGYLEALPLPDAERRRGHLQLRDQPHRRDPRDAPRPAPAGAAPRSQLGNQRRPGAHETRDPSAPGRTRACPHLKSAPNEGPEDGCRRDAADAYRSCRPRTAPRHRCWPSGRAPTETVAVYGDAPYGTTPTDTAQFVATPAFVDSINADPDVSLVLHVGDIHSGKQFCTEAYDRSIYDLWTAFQDPLIYTPGDNEWSDCHKAAEGGGTYNASTQQIDLVLDGAGIPADYANGDPIANLALVRSVFFATPGASLGARKQRVLSQAQFFDRAHPTDAAFVENVMWEQSQVLFVTINLPGGSNNDADVWYAAPTPTAAQAQEIADRTGADLRWLDTAFAAAEAGGLAAVLLQFQADMWDPEKGAAHQAGYEPFVQSIASHATVFGKPVIAFNGDSHVYLSHNPLSPADALSVIHPGYDVPNFHRVVVHGSTFPLEWLRLTIDPRANAPEGPNAFGPFSWQRVIQPAVRSERSRSTTRGTR